MLDIKFIREHKDLVTAGAKKKHLDFDVDKLITVDDKRREMLKQVEDKRNEQNLMSQKIGIEKTEALKHSMIAEMQVLKAELQKEESELRDIMKEWQELMIQVPNLPDISVPEGKDDDANVEVRKWGDKPSFDFEIKDQVALAELHDLVDFERGSKVAGFRGYYLKNEAALLSMALWQFTIDQLSQKGFVPLFVPSLVRRETLLGTGYIPQGEDDLYKTQDGDYLAGTGEVASMAYYQDEVLDKNKLPTKFLAFSPCFRREAGSHGKDTRGLIRVHEFFKMEQIILDEASHEKTVAHHEALTKNAEEILQALKLPYHVVINCGGDLGLGQVKKYDIEVWVPSENKYRETHSSSYFHDFQTRRLNIRYKDTDGKLKFAHSLNNTAIATPRVLVAILENYQQADGSIKIPEVLQKYCGGKTVINRAVSS